MNSRRCAFLFLIFVLMPALALAQVHEGNFGRYKVRVALAPGTSLPAQRMDKHAIAPGADRMVLSVTVLDKNINVSPKSVAASVQVRMRSKGRSFHTIAMHTNVDNGGLSYIGAIPVRRDRMTARFIVTVRPPNSVPLTIVFHEVLRRTR